ncbi:MAG: peptide ABC transporter substrate-binding protein [Bacillota bacterium]|jgi:oligopeptide transport system substrate-binding protein|nr:peptide ABC transporter substrate-binding protein [Bacillota bacterium]HHT91767.1 peptide ABC transporter substrate-binding protein [Bacillota bacterium]
MKRVKSVVVLLIVMVLVLQLGLHMAAAKDVVTMNIGSDPRSVDPALASTTNEHVLVNQLFEGLTRQGPEGIVPGVAREWSFDQDTNTYTFVLRDAQFSNGDPITAEDFVYSWKRALDPRTGSEYAYQLYYIKGAQALNEIDLAAADAEEQIHAALETVGVRAVDAKTLEVTLEGLAPYFLSLVAFPTYHPVNKNVVEENPDWGAQVSSFVSNGPYVLQSWVHGEKIVLVKNEKYWDQDTVSIDQLDFLMIEQANTQLIMWETGQLDITTDNLPVTELDRLEKEGVLKKQPVIATRFIFLNNERAPFDDPNVRNALSMALDRAAITHSVIKSGSTPAIAYVPPGMPEGTTDFREVGGTLIEEDAAKAKALLAEAGYPEGAGFPDIEIMISANEKTKAIAEACIEMWKKNLNITTIEVRSVESKIASERRRGFDFDMTFSGWYGDFLDPMTFLELATSKSGQNSMQYANPEFDRLIEEVNSSSDEQERMAKMHQAEAILMKDMPLIPINVEGSTYLSNPRVQGVFRNILNMVDFKWAYIAQ